MFKKLLISAIMASTFAGVQAASVSGTTNFKVTVPEILVLYHWDEAHLNLTANNPDSVRMGDSALTSTIGAASYDIETNSITAANANAPTNYLGSAINVTLKNSWAVRAITSQNNVYLKAGFQQATDGNKLYLGGSSSATQFITLGTPKLKTGTGTAASPLTITSKWAPTIGDMTFTMDMSKATKNGVYRSVGSADGNGRNLNKDTFLLTLSTATP